MLINEKESACNQNARKVARLRNANRLTHANLPRRFLIIFNTAFDNTIVGSNDNLQNSYASFAPEY